MHPTNAEAAQAVTRARATLILDQPFFGTLALRLIPVERWDLPTAATDGVHLFYNPAFMLALSAACRQTVLAHEVLHCVLDHIGRCGNRVYEKWAHAIDYAANLLLKDAKFVEPPCGWLCNEAYRGMSAEHIYTLLPDPPSGWGAAGPGEPGGPLDDVLAPGIGPGAATAPDPAALSREWTVATLSAAAAAQGYGNLPASLQRLVESKVAPQIDWQTSLRRFLTERINDDYSWARPNRHMMVYNVYLPSLYRESFGHMVIAVDVSGSIDAPTLAAFSAEIDAFCAAIRPRKLTVIYCDAAVAGIDVFEAGDPVVLAPRGGGGTAFEPVFDAVAELDEPPAALAYLTDLYGPTNFPAPPYPVLWCCTTEREGPWGETLRISI
jgi:predicted metal-dependent peptidase